ncbi:hypothetical protein F4813DRAFT_360617 [Daldinia decipiens]|uniref:uncharacterized protein n=1 Tax=Daldinia decipiens TaxID=326647 RepID=UPI0020C24128|nr:uncharacterized protein F4813DRAFT_360617 [Daldinia decipiens]KAI1657196.1 hypothetical protein F4813DRAFT_360617 [Daldinia decipiens]
MTNISDRQQTTERSASPPRRQRACAPCTKAKARCHFEGNKVEDGCDRCRRMKIICAPQTSKSLRRPRQIKPPNTEPADPSNDSYAFMRPPNYGHILLKAGPFTMTDHDSSVESITPPPAPPVTESPPYNGTATRTLGNPYSPTSRVSQPLPILPAKKIPQPGFGLTWDQAEYAVSNFKIKFTPFFPFVVLDPDVTAQEILAKKPLLFRAIMLVASHLTLAKQSEIRKSILAYVGQHVLVMEERDLGILQGLLVFIAWGEHDFYFDQKITYLTHLAMGYAHNLAITRPPPTMQQKMTVAVNPKDVKEALMGYSMTTVLEESHTPEEQRAFLGCKYLLSVNASQFGRDGVLKGDYVDRCLNSVGNPTDFGTDFILDKIVRFQQIVEQISEKLPMPSEGDRSKVFTISMNEDMQSIRNQLNQLFANMAREHRQFVLFWAMHNYVLVRLYLPASSLSPPQDEVAAQLQRQCMLYCLQAARSFFVTIVSIGTEGFLYRSFTSFSEILFVLVAASRLLLVEIDGWDLAEARKTFDFPATMESVISTFKNIISLEGQRAAEAAATFGVNFTPDTADDIKTDRFYKYATKLEWIKSWFSAQLTLVPGVGLPGEPQIVSGSSNWAPWAPYNQAWNPFMFGFLGDDNWNIDF